jgi:hypothetical protein
MWAAACSTAILGVGLFLPLWGRVKSQNGCCIVMENVPVWRGLIDDRPGLPSQPERVQENNRIACSALLAVAGCVGAIAYWVRRPRIPPLEADDYSDGPGGSVPDGRVAQ